MAGRNFRSLWSDAVTQQARKIFPSYTKPCVYLLYLVLTITAYGYNSIEKYVRNLLTCVSIHNRYPCAYL